MKAFKKFLLVSLAAAGLMAFSTPAQAGVVIDFGTGLAGAGGTVTELGGGQYSGTGILIGAMTVTGTASADGVYVTNATLAFNTLTNTIAITGAIPSLGIASQTLLSGSFTSFSFQNFGAVGAFNASGLDVKSQDLLTALGIPLTTQWIYFAFTLNVNSGTAGVWNATSTDILNTEVPEPGSMLLLGTGLLGLGAVVRRRIRRR